MSFLLNSQKANLEVFLILTSSDANRFWSGVDRGNFNDCWLWKCSCLPKGYGLFYLNGKRERANRVSWTLVNGLIPEFFEGLPSQICHSCDNPPCCNPGHLFLGNNKINVRDSVIKGRHTNPVYFGAFNPRAQITELQAIEIKERYKSGETQTQIAGIYGVAQQTVSQICSGKRWFHVKI